jgi:hypothetical protein
MVLAGSSPQSMMMGTYPHPLQAWWLVLFSLSTFARYQPAQWREALDVDQSQVAVRLEHALDVALTALPKLILQALLDLVEKVGSNE